MLNPINGAPSGYVMRWVIPAVLLLLSSSASAVLLDIDPPGQTISEGGQASVDVYARSLGTDRVGAFDIALSFDGALLGFNDVIFGTGLGDPVLDSITSVTTSTSDQVGVAQVSLLFSLSGLQDGSDLRLFSLVFDGLSEGISPVNISSALISDESGLPLGVNFGQSATVLVEPRSVPEPGVLLLFSIGLVMLGATRAKEGSGSGLPRFS